MRAQLLRQRRGPVAPEGFGAEVRLLPLLPTHLTMTPIAAGMFLLQHTVRTQATSICRKLGAATRRQAVARARQPWFLDG